MSKAKRILVVEDDSNIMELLRINLSMTGFEVSQAANTDEALACLQVAPVNLVMVDWNMPGRSGLWLLRYLRQSEAYRQLPIILATARDDELDKVQAFDAGVDDYITKPFKMRELLARVQSLLRRTQPNSESDLLEVDGLSLHLDQYRASIAGYQLSLGPTEFKLLHFLASNPMRVHTRAQLLNHVWGNALEVQERTVDAYVARLRGTIEATGHYACIETVRSMGYRFVRFRDASAKNAAVAVGAA
jgi:two-component system, OmpR family, phosphate regulon response regulator PhoB